ncbi:hypothetical protein WA026_005395 [Henosepilachna vigintioctopunctata]|uniref:5'-deoxynucleotidase HDDC2 n=1 Tax=Henosepilachna vigintioctopunctata TaxID=420089 RepID=A0AAW1U105_9CUCU
MENLNPKDVLEFIRLVNVLKHSSRRGWEQCNVEHHEQIAGHMYGMAMMTFLLGNNSTLDRYKCLQLALVHDLAECIVGDITPRDNIPEEKKHAMEDEAMKKIAAHLGSEIGELIYNLYKEYEAKESPEAKFVKDLDIFDMLFSASFYEKRDKTPGRLQEYFTATLGKIQNPYFRNLVRLLEDERMTLSNGHIDDK